jgi:PIN domain nuclease of toxin-antitoxin system
MNEPLLLDTHALIWLVQGEPMRPEAREAIRAAAIARSLFVSLISAWEIANLVRKNRLVLNRDVEDWFDAAVRIPGMQLAGLSAAILIRSAFLPADPPSDPADRILISTSRQNSFRLITRDRQIIEYATAGHVHALKC